MDKFKTFLTKKIDLPALPVWSYIAALLLVLIAGAVLL